MNDPDLAARRLLVLDNQAAAHCLRAAVWGLRGLDVDSADYAAQLQVVHDASAASEAAYARLKAAWPVPPVPAGVEA